MRSQSNHFPSEMPTRITKGVPIEIQWGGYEPFCDRSQEIVEAVTAWTVAAMQIFA